MTSEKRVGIDNSPQTTRTMPEASLGRFGTDMIDLYLVHFQLIKVDIRKTMEVLAVLVNVASSIIGLSNTFKEDLIKLEKSPVSMQYKSKRVSKPRALDLIEQTQDLSNLGVMSWGISAKGILTAGVQRQNLRIR